MTRQGWYCPGCAGFKKDNEVTYDFCCTNCGTIVYWNSKNIKEEKDEEKILPNVHGNGTGSGCNL